MLLAAAFLSLCRPIVPPQVHHRATHSASTPATAEWALLRKHVKHVFVLYQENRSFDHYFGTFPGAEGLFSHPASATPGFYQTMIGADGKPMLVHPFRLGPSDFASDTSDVDHSHEAIVSKMHLMRGEPQMDHFALSEEKEHFAPGTNPTSDAVSYGQLTMAYVDGDTIPILWQWASRFVLCDHIFQTITGPSTPGNLTIIAAQTGVSQWIQHPEEAAVAGDDSGVPMTNDNRPYWGSMKDKTAAMDKMPYNPKNLKSKAQINLTFPSLPITLTGKNMKSTAKTDRDYKGDLGDIDDDVSFLGTHGSSPVPWGWYQEGFDKEPTDGVSSDPVDAKGRHASYVTHHNGPQYFGYVSNNPAMSSHMHGLDDLFVALQNHSLPDKGVFYVKGGYQNILGLKPADPDPDVQKAFLGDDDHPAYSDSQISEAMLAHVVNLIAKSGYWKDSVIIITWDDSEGDYDHVRPPIRTLGPDKMVLDDGPRVPMLILSPYARKHSIFHGVGDQASVVKFVGRLFGLTPLADLPVERRLRKIGEKRGIVDAGPRDALTPGVTDLLGVFDMQRLSGKMPALSASYVEIPDGLVNVLPPVSGLGLKQLGIVTTDRRHKVDNEVPAGFNPRPKG